MHRIAFVVASTWLVMGSVSLGQGVRGNESRVQGGGAERAKMLKMEQWNNDTKLYIDGGYRPKKNYIPDGSADPSYLVVNGIASFDHHRFTVKEIIDDKTTLLQLEKKSFLLVDYPNKKLKVDEIVRLVPAVQVVESQEHEGKALVTMKLSTMRKLLEYQKSVNKKK
ncbi:hypothetical protein SH449x_000733 [Pirellulaceae bacterium SH449]